ncbi:sensor histidine kinase [Streptomyces sp. BI20]|uniref:sensor histidine kinase n=1 Tax=Streptomyces sp. BI20 TaxID=3403460 RepID=UPI003C752130
MSAVVGFLRAPVSGRTWREFGYVLTGFPLAVLYFCAAVTGLSLGAGLLVTFIGVPVLAGALMLCRGFGFVERARARVLLGAEVADPEPVRAAKPGVLASVGAVLRSGSAWRHVLYMFLHFPWAVFSFSVALTVWVYGWAMFLYPLWHWTLPTFADEPGLAVFSTGDRQYYLATPLAIALASLIGLAVVLVTPALLRGLTTVDRVLVGGLLGASASERRVARLESDRGAAVDTAAADLRRFERELHDGAQARLSAVAMGLGSAKERMQGDPEGAARLVDDAHGEVKTALRELRELARGLYPAVLTDRGLDAALSAVAARGGVPVRVSVDLPADGGRPAPAVERLAYLAVSELLANVDRHAGASRASVEVWRSEERLLLRVEDDGRGGAAVVSGRGLADLSGRLGSVDGVLDVVSPAAGGTVVTAELPWRG